MKAFQSVAALLFSVAIGAVLLIVLFSSGSRSHASGESEIDVLWRAVSKLESRVKQLEAGCGCECSRTAAKPAKIRPALRRFIVRSPD